MTVTPAGLRLADTGDGVPLFSGSVQYWRLEPQMWPRILRTVRELGFSLIETYVPWGVHETSRGQFDFSGPRDLDAFLEIAEAEGLMVIARPGPHINAELSEFGYPARIVHDPAMQAKTAHGAPSILAVPPRAFPIVSYASEPFFGEVAVWFDEICPRLAKHLYPDGPIVLIQADNENSYFFKLSPYDVDYSDWAIGQYQEFLEQRYGTIDLLNRVYGTAYESFAQIRPPRRFHAETGRDLLRYLDWARAKEAYLTRSVARIADMLRDRGLGRVPIFHNTPGAYGTPYNHPAIEQVVDVQGIDLYEHVGGYNVIKRNCLYLTGTSRLPILPEFGAGAWPWWRPIDGADAQHNTLTALMHGIKGINYYMAVERDRWLGSPIGRVGELRDGSDFYGEILALLRDIDWTSYRRRNDVLLLDVREYEQHAYVARVVSPPFGPPILGPLEAVGRAYGALATRFPTRHALLGLGVDVPSAVRDFTEASWAQLTAAHIPFAVGDSASGTEWLGRFRVVVAPGFRYMTRETQQTLANYAIAGGRLVIGPEIPSVDEWMTPCPVLSDVVSSVTRLPQPDQLPAVLARLGISTPWTLDNPAIDISAHEHGEACLLFLANPTSRPQTGSLRLPEASGLVPLLPVSNVCRGGDGVFEVELASHDVQLFKVLPC